MENSRPTLEIFYERRASAVLGYANLSFAIRGAAQRVGAGTR